MSPANLFHPFTNAHHKTTYTSISRSKPSSSAKGKTILITGSSSGTGLAICSVFAEAGASNIIIVARRADPLAKAEDILLKSFPATRTYTFAASITDGPATESGFEAIQTTIVESDILLLRAASECTQSPVLTIPEAEIQRDFDTNVTANLNWVRHFLLPETCKLNVNKKILSISSCSAHMTLPGRGSYGANKEAFVLLLGQVQWDYANSGVNVFNFHPGMDSISWGDTGSFAVWLVSGEADFLAGLFVYANWDVDKLKARAREKSRATC
ncbi:MAG: hypothetical protein Q9166_000631 [cf. Caloplaca sp. 2 TL-2023]